MASVYNRGTKDRPNWWVQYTDPSGETKRKRTGQPTKKLAEQYSAEITARLARGLIGIPEKETVKKSLLTVGQLLERFLVEYRSPQVRNIEKYLRHCASAYRARIKPYRLANIAAEKVRPSDVEGLRDELIDDGYSAKSINDAFFVLSVAYKWAIRREVLNARNPMPDVPRMRTNELDERLTLDQVWRLLSLPSVPPTVTTAVYTGLRRGELFGLRWADVRFDLGTLEIKRSFDSPTTKTGKSRTVPIHPELLPVLKAWQAQCPATPDALVFPIRTAKGYRMRSPKDDPADIRGMLDDIAPRDGGYKRPWHCLRHTFATLFVEANGNRDAVERILGHATSGSRTTSGYLHVGLAYLARELQKLTLRPQAGAEIIRLRATA